MPNTNLPVTVNTINGGNPIGTDPQNAQFYRDNSQAVIDNEMDGLTTVLTCSGNVNAGVSNHMKLAIADGSDSSLDSNVFIGAGSLVSGTQISTTLTGGANWDGDHRAVGNCGARFDDAFGGHRHRWGTVVYSVFRTLPARRPPAAVVRRRSRTGLCPTRIRSPSTLRARTDGLRRTAAMARTMRWPAPVVTKP